MNYIYPNLHGKEFGFFRAGGFGLGNCMFVAARAHLLSLKTGLPMLRPTWERFSIGTILRHEKDKRFYYGLFKPDSVWDKLKKIWVANFSRLIDEKSIQNKMPDRSVFVHTMGGFFSRLQGYTKEVQAYFSANIEPSAIDQVPVSLKNSIALHVRLGDYPAEWRTDLSWYAGVVKKLLSSTTKNYDILIFSDGSDDELREVLSLPKARRVFFGNALADIVAISRCAIVVGSASTFSSWGTYLGQVPSIYPKNYNPEQYVNILDDVSMFCQANTVEDVSGVYIDVLRKKGIL